jgi:hypothetical protein
MTPFYVASFKRSHKCASCPAKKVGGKSLCAYHLRVAREAWDKWAKARRAAGKCTYCPRKSYHGFLRCKAHTEQNRAKCQAWGAAHPDRATKAWAKRREVYAANGLCMYCRDHRPAIPGKLRCQPCNDNLKSLKAGTRAPWSGTSLPQRGPSSR